RHRHDRHGKDKAQALHLNSPLVSAAASKMRCPLSVENHLSFEPGAAFSGNPPTKGETKPISSCSRDASAASQ
ncbi:MAG: hypothetical protein KKH54_03855, partial [Alphaproteobacteria bacterium]|nr:hypothetical protein [Alphaproteobacteria bacterium]